LRCIDAALNPSRAVSFDLFCRVVDNYGDIGVCWRLARQLTQHASVRLWVDDLHSFARIAPQVVPDAPMQTLCGIQIRCWADAGCDDVQPLDVIIEAFGCELPPAFAARIQPGQCWLHLEYLSAESWVEDCHGLPSPQPDGRLKHFFFPGFTPKTGGLLREPGLLAQRDAWQAAPARRATLLQALGVPGAWISGLLEKNEAHRWRQVYAFCYPQAPLSWLLAGGHTPAAPTVLLAAPGTPATPQAEHLHRIDCPFVEQAQFDELLWSSDLNLVRGEDSFVRAIWAARPFLWHIYSQAQDAHLPKLNAWLALDPCPPPAAALMRAWNQSSAKREHSALDATLLAPLLQPASWQCWQTQARQYSARQARQADLVQQLLQFVRHCLFPRQAL